VGSEITLRELLMTKQSLSLIATLLILIGLVLIVVGTSGADLLWQLGLSAVGLAMLASLGTRWAKTSSPERGGPQPEDDRSRDA